MPVMGGHEATKRIRQLAHRETNPETPNPAIIALTAGAFEENRQKAQDAGCDGFVRKPFREREIFETMRKHLGVRYVFDAEPHGKDETIQPSDNEKSSQEAHYELPPEWIGILERGAAEADVNVIYEVIEKIRPHDAALAGTLTRFAENYDYDGILATIMRP